MTNEMNVGRRARDTASTLPRRSETVKWRYLTSLNVEFRAFSMIAPVACSHALAARKAAA